MFNPSKKYGLKRAQRGISALKLSKQKGVYWLTARNVLKKIGTAIAHRDSIYRLQNLLKLDDAIIGGKRTGKRGRGAKDQNPVLVAVKTCSKDAGFVAMQVVDTVSKKIFVHF